MRVKTVRDDILREEELKSMLEKLEGKDVIVGKYKTTVHGKLRAQKFYVKCRQTECLLALLWIFGRRVMEILLMKRKDIWIEGDFLYARFRTLKRKKKTPTPERFVKRITLEHPYTHYITDYISNIDNPESYVFPGRSRFRRYTTKRKRKHYKRMLGTYDDFYVADTYEYERSEHGFMSANKAWKTIKFLNPNAYCHLFRHSLATRMAEHGYTEDQLMSWFDWMSPAVAHNYVKKGTRMIEVASRRTW